MKWLKNRNEECPILFKEQNNRDIFETLDKIDDSIETRTYTFYRLAGSALEEMREEYKKLYVHAKKQYPFKDFAYDSRLKALNFVIGTTDSWFDGSPRFYVAVLSSCINSYYNSKTKNFCIGFAVMNPEDTFNLKEALRVGIKKGLEGFANIYVMDKRFFGLLNSDVALSTLRREIELFEKRPQLYIKTYEDKKKRYESERVKSE